MNSSIDERGSAQAFEIWRRIAAEPHSWSADARDMPSEPPSAASNEASSRAIVAAIVSVANAPLPMIAVLALALRPLRRLRASRLGAARASSVPVDRRAIA